jgi:transposase
MGVLIGIDPHKATNAVAAIDERGELLEYAVFSTNRAGLRSLARWGKRFPERRWAVEGAGGLGRFVALRLVAAGELVMDVPAKLSSRRVFLPRATPARTIGWTPFTSPWPHSGANG